MTKASDNAFPSILITEGTEPSAPAAGKQRLYIDSTTHKLKRTDSSGVDVTIEGASSGATFHGCLATRTTDQTGVVTATDTVVAFNAADISDSDAFHDTVTNNSRITIPTGLDGKYHFSAYVIWDSASATGFRRVSLRKNGTTLFAQQSMAGSSTFYEMQTVSIGPITMAATDYMEVVVHHTSGANRILSGSVVNMFFGAELVGV